MVKYVDTIRRKFAELTAPPPPQREGPRVFGVGCAKTGTHSLGEMFEGFVETRHEPDAIRLIQLLLERERTGDRTKLLKFLEQRDRKLQLKVNASHVNIYLIQELEELFDDSRYVLTIRQPLHWLRSFTDDSLRRDARQEWIDFRKFRFGPASGHPDAEAPLAERGLFTLAGYFGYWESAISTLRARIPAERLMIVQTEELGPRASEIAAFAGIDIGEKGPSKTHSFQNTERFGVLDDIDRDYLLATCEATLGETARAVLPGWSAADEAERLLKPVPA